MELKAQPKAKRGRPSKNLNPDKAFVWFDEFDYQRALQDRKLWETKFEECKQITGTDFENIIDFENELRSKHPELAKLDIEQLYIIDGLDRITISNAFSDFSRTSKVDVNKESYMIKIPAENANEYSQYLSICQAFNNLRALGNVHINTGLIPNLTGNRIVLDHRSMKLIPNAYRFTADNK
ncbi:hypothetical protein N9V61_04135 [Flavobacteriaceae bacterium]|nr:hypothetical protein [Flavobacteriaceae bacterium]